MNSNLIRDRIDTRSDGYKHTANGQYDRGRCTVSVHTVVTVQKYREVLDHFPLVVQFGDELWSDPVAIDGVIITPKMATKGFSELAHHFPLHWSEITDPCNDVEKETARLWVQLAQGVEYKQLDC